MMAKYFATSLAMEKVVSAPRVMSSCLPISTISISLVGSLSRSIMLPASRAAMVPVFMATPTSACASAGASLVPSPHMATSLPLACSSRMSWSLFSGVACARKSSTPASAAIAAAVKRIVARDHHRADAHAPKLGKALADAALDDVLQMDDTEQLAMPGHGQRRAAHRRNRFREAFELARRWHVRVAVNLPDVIDHGVDRAFADLVVLKIDAADARLRGERDEMRAERRHVPPADAVALLGQHHDGAAFRASRREARRAARHRRAASR